MNQCAADNTVSTTAKRILIVDDEESIHQVFQGLFKSPRYTVSEALSGEIALKMAQAQTFDLAFIDVIMPGISGIETSRLLRQLQPALKTVLITGFMTDDVPGAMAESGASHMLRKPFSIMAAMSLAEKLLA